MLKSIIMIWIIGLYNQFYLALNENLILVFDLVCSITNKPPYYILGPSLWGLKFSLMKENDVRYVLAISYRTNKSTVGRKKTNIPLYYSFSVVVILIQFDVKWKSVIMMFLKKRKSGRYQTLRSKSTINWKAKTRPRVETFSELRGKNKQIKTSCVSDSKCRLVWGNSWAFSVGERSGFDGYLLIA